jgi:hypothetical protein
VNKIHFNSFLVENCLAVIDSPIISCFGTSSMTSGKILNSEYFFSSSSSLKIGTNFKRKYKTKTKEISIFDSSHFYLLTISESWMSSSLLTFSHFRSNKKVIYLAVIYVYSTFFGINISQKQTLCAYYNTVVRLTLEAFWSFLFKIFRFCQVKQI